MKKKVRLNFGKKRIILETEVMNGLGEVIGLMFSRRESAKNLLFEFPNPVRLSIHSVFVFFPFIAIWLDTDGKIIEIKKVKPFSLRVCPQKKFSSFVEIPINRKNRKIVVDIEKFK
jgi:uncharacterized membrane protein (UPF0127 family)